MTEWNERQLQELVRKMGLERTPGQQKSPIHLSLYGPFWKPEPLLTKIMQLGTGWWTAMGYDETDRVSVVRYLLAKLLVDAGCDPAEQDRNGWNALVHLAAGGHPEDPQVTDLFLSAGCRTDLDGCRRIGGAKFVRDDMVVLDRDYNGARGIFLRGLCEIPPSLDHERCTTDDLMQFCQV